MKKLLLFLSLTTGIGQIFSQETFNRAYHSRVENPNSFLVNINGDLFFSAQSRDVSNFGVDYLYKHSGSGSLKFRSSALGGFILKGFRSLDNKLIVAGRISFCDVVTQQVDYLTKLDTNGVAVFTSTYSAVLFDPPKDCIQLTDSSYFTFSDSLVYKHSKSGQYLSKTNLGLTQISAALSLPNNEVLISAKQANSISLIKMAANGTFISIYTFPVLCTKLINYEGQQVLALGTDGKIYKLSTHYSQIGTSAFTNASVIDFVYENGTVYSILTTLSTLSKYAVSDSSFISNSLSATTTNSLSQNAICLSSGKVAILSTGLASNSGFGSSSVHYFASLNVIDKSSSNNFQSDLALVSVSIDSTYNSCYFSPFPSPGSYQCATYMRPKVKIKNKGTTVITKFKLNSFDSPGIACGGYFYQEQFSGFTLQPGDSITLTASTFARKAYAYSGTASSFTTSYCFYTSVPNDETDKVVEDNENCNTYNFTITSLKEYSGKDFSVKLFPNPFENVLSIESDEQFKNIEILNSLGIVVYTNATSDKHFIVSTKELGSGIYFIKIETEKGSAIRKIIKQ